MADIKDIMGVSRMGEAPAEKPAPKAKAPRMKRPEGMSREAFALLGDSHPIMSSIEQLVPKKDVKAKPKPSTKGIVTWLYRPFSSTARTDGYELKKWTKTFKDAHGRIKEPDDADYYFAKFNKHVRAGIACMGGSAFASMMAGPRTSCT